MLGARVESNHLARNRVVTMMARGNSDESPADGRGLGLSIDVAFSPALVDRASIRDRRRLRVRRARSWPCSISPSTYSSHRCSRVIPRSRRCLPEKIESIRFDNSCRPQRVRPMLDFPAARLQQSVERAGTLRCDRRHRHRRLRVAGAASAACQQQRALGGLHEAPLAGHGPSRQAESAE